jgi:hypothetical protein
LKSNEKSSLLAGIFCGKNFFAKKIPADFVLNLLRGYKAAGINGKIIKNENYRVDHPMLAVTHQ